MAARNRSAAVLDQGIAVVEEFIQYDTTSREEVITSMNSNRFSSRQQTETFDGSN